MTPISRDRWKDSRSICRVTLWILGVLGLVSLTACGSRPTPLVEFVAPRGTVEVGKAQPDGASCWWFSVKAQPPFGDTSHYVKRFEVSAREQTIFITARHAFISGCSHVDNAYTATVCGVQPGPYSVNYLDPDGTTHPLGSLDLP